MSACIRKDNDYEDSLLNRTLGGPHEDLAILDYVSRIRSQFGRPAIASEERIGEHESGAEE